MTKKLRPNRPIDYLPVDFAQIEDQGALCYLMGTFDGWQGGDVRLVNATVSYEDAACRIHANLFPLVRCRAANSDTLVPGAMVRIVAELERRSGQPFYVGTVYDRMDPVFETDPASAVNRRFAMAARHA